MKNKMLLIIDAQYDFINGSLAVKNAEAKMTDLAEFINKSNDEYKCIVFTADNHPNNHCSFTDEGGQWPPHCRKHTKGAAIYEPIYNAVVNKKIKFDILTKGCLSKKEEYSIMDNNLSRYAILYMIKNNDIDSIDICGIANEYCVLQTVKDLNEKFNLGNKLNILMDYIAAIEDDNVLINYCKKNNLNIK